MVPVLLLFLIVLSLTIRARTHGAGSMVWNESISDLPWYDSLNLWLLFSDSPFFVGLVIGSAKTGSSIDQLIQCPDILKCSLRVHFLVEDRHPESLSRHRLLEKQVRKLESNRSTDPLHVLSSLPTTRGRIHAASRISLPPIDIPTSHI
jgi:hypothetical protein